MIILFIKHFIVGFMVSEIPRVSVFGPCPYSITFPYYIGELIFPLTHPHIIGKSYLYIIIY